MLKKIVAFVIFALCALYVQQATHFAFGTLSNPKAGFVPMLVGCAGLILAGINLVQVLRANADKEPDKTETLKVMLVVLGLVGYVALLPAIGFLIATFLALVYLLFVTGARNWRIMLLVPAGTALVLWFGFTSLLQLQLP